MALTSEPIWKDKVFNFGNLPMADYDLRADGQIFYKGRAVRRPHATDLEFKINDVVAGVMKQSFPTQLEEPSIIKDYVDVSIYIAGREVQTAIFRNDWSYDRNYDPLALDGILSAPINGKVSPKQMLIFTKTGLNALEVPAITIKVTDRQGEVTETSVQSGLSYNYLYAIPEGADTITLNDKVTFKVSDGCERFCLYYLNEFGGWDSLLLEGRGSQTDNYKRFTHRREYDNQFTMEAGAVNYLNEVTRAFELHTGWLYGDEGGRMHHLLSSPQVLMLDFETGLLVPVLIKDNECKYKDYHNNGGQLVDYTINVEVARDYRRL